MGIVELEKAGSSYCLAILFMFELYNEHVKGKAGESKERKRKGDFGLWLQPGVRS